MKNTKIDWLNPTLFTLEQLIAVGLRASQKMHREYKQLEPDARENECWAEVEQFDDMLEAAQGCLTAVRLAISSKGGIS